MDKVIESSIINHHQVNIVDRKNISISGVKKVIKFGSEEFVIDSNMGTIIIKGSDLEMIKLDTSDGNIAVKGIIDSYNYVSELNTNKESFLAKLFR